MSGGGAAAGAGSNSGGMPSGPSGGANVRPAFKPTAVSEAAYEFLLSEVWRWVVEHEEEEVATAHDNGDAKEEVAILAAERAAARIERMGYDVGYRLCERLAQAKPLAPPPPSVGGTQGPVGLPSAMPGGVTSPIAGGPMSPAAAATPDVAATTPNAASTAPSPSVASSQLEAVKFLCKEFWMVIFRKQIDKLQTNHRGVFVLKDFDLRWLRRLPNDDELSRVAAIKMLAFPCGLVRGALANLGIASVVSCDFLVDGKNMSACSFNIKVKA